MDEESPWGYWIEAACRDDLIEGDVGPLRVLADHDVNYFNGKPLERCLDNGTDRFRVLYFYMNAYADKHIVARDKYLEYELLQRVVERHNFRSWKDSKFTTPEQWDDDGKLRAELLIEAGLNPVMIGIRKKDWWTLGQIYGTLPPPDVGATAFEAASLYTLPKTAEYLKTEYEKGPCTHNNQRNNPMKHGDHIDIYGFWNEIANGKFRDSGNGFIYDDMLRSEHPFYKPIDGYSEHAIAIRMPGDSPPLGRGDWKSSNSFVIKWDDKTIPPLEATVDPSGCQIKWSNGKIWGR